MNWKDYLYFHRAERLGAIVLLILIIVVALAPFLHRFLQPSTKVDFTAFRQAAQQFENQQEELRAHNATPPPPTQSPEKIVSTPPVLQLRPFDPNGLSPEEWGAMGIPSHISRNIHNYLKAGGRFRYKHDLARIYTIDDALFAALEPYIELPLKPAAPTTAPENPSPAEKKAEPLPSAPEHLLIDINLADSAGFTRLYGIGPVFSRRIVEYREKLGGFHSKAQLLEVFGMDSTRMAGIADQVVADSASLRKLDINTASFEQLLHHPYITYNVANSIISLRKQHGPFHQVEDVQKSALIDQALFSKLAPYLKASADTLAGKQ